MQFSDILGTFDIVEVLYIDHYLLGQRGYLFHLKSGVAYLYEETKGERYSQLVLNSTIFELTQNELDKIHSIMRLNRIKPRKLTTKDLWVYSRQIEKAMEELLESRPDLLKGSSHMAFLPRNYTRFSENLVFDFNYMFHDIKIADTIRNFDNIYRKEIYPNLNSAYSREEYSDDHLYRYLLDYTKALRVSVNGKISAPIFLKRLFEYAASLEADQIIIHFGPFLLYLSTTREIQRPLLRYQNADIEQLENHYEIIYPDIGFILDLFGDLLETELDEI